jgi:glycosyltransferase involved in cell wall biosynthesis
VAAARALAPAPAPSPRPFAPAPIRVLLATDKLGYADARLHGAGRLVVDWTRSFDPARVRVQTVVFRDPSGLAAELGRAGLPIEVLGAGRSAPACLAELLRIVRRERVDVLHVQEFAAGTLGRVAGLLARRPVVLHVHADYGRVAIGGYPAYVRRLDRLLAPATARAIAISDAVRDFAIEGMGLAPERTVVLHNPVGDGLGREPGEARLAELQRRYGIPAGAPVVGTVTRFHPTKGNPDLVDAFARVAAEIPDARLLFVGGGTGRAALAAQAAALGIAGRVIFAGFQEDVAAHLRLLTVFALPSLEEGLSVAIAEAMTAGLPVVATRVGGIPELVEDGKTGLLVPPGRPTELAAALLAVLSNSGLRSRLAAAARDESCRFAMNRFLVRMEEIYREAMAESRSGRRK